MKSSLFLVLISGCACATTWKGADPATGEAVVAECGAMPAGHSFSGKYDTTKLGKPLELTQIGDKVSGKWSLLRAPDNDCVITGALQGEAKANLIKFTWTEDLSACGQEPRQGRGWALYRLLEGRDKRPRLYGKRGLQSSADNEGPWLGIAMTETSTAG